ncbi:MAG TPA: hemerythrin domain-containing protein [Bacteroidota bacterium]|nr:hemerythrin domain-containing protein [Bacteroidota bacterium]
MDDQDISTPSHYLERDHRRLEHVFSYACDIGAGVVDMDLYNEFRSGLLRHVGIEEKIVLPLLRKHLPGGFPMEAQLRLDHGALAALLVPPPEHEVVTVIRNLLTRHNALEEAHGTLYDLLDSCAELDEGNIFEQIKRYPAVPLSRYINNPGAIEPARRAVARAGYAWEDLLRST